MRPLHDDGFRFMSTPGSDSFIIDGAAKFRDRVAPRPERTRPTIGVGISTRDRWDDLAITLARIERSGLHRRAVVIVVDDGSKQPAPAELVAQFAWARFERSPVSRGYIAQRNWLARELGTTLYLSLDDDSFVAAGQVEEAADWLMQRPDVAAVCFSILQGPDHLVCADARPRQPQPIRFYIGCAHLVKRELFLELGGYREELEHLCEEVQFALAAARRDYEIWYYPYVVVRHYRSNVGRDHARAQRLLTRNDLYCAAMYFPWPYLLLSAVFCLPRKTGHASHRRYWRSVWSGFREALLTLPRVWRWRAPLSWSQMRRWRRAVHPHDVVELVTVESSAGVEVPFPTPAVVQTR